jgi:hypothetical protein
MVLAGVVGVTACRVAQAYLAGAPAKPPQNRRKTAAKPPQTAAKPPQSRRKAAAKPPLKNRRQRCRFSAT